jgi:hypothetical protein
MNPSATLMLAGRARRRTAKALQRGYDLTQLILGIIVIAVLAGAVYYAFSAVMHNVSQGKNANYINGIAGGLKKNLGSQNLYASVTTSLAVSQHIIPQELKNNAAAPWTAANTYGGAITVVPNAAGLSTPNDTATLTWNNVDGAECNDLVIATAAVARLVQVGATTVKPKDGTLDIAGTATACDANPTSNIVYQVGRS